MEQLERAIDIAINELSANAERKHIFFIANAHFNRHMNGVLMNLHSTVFVNLINEIHNIVKLFTGIFKFSLKNVQVMGISKVCCINIYFFLPAKMFACCSVQQMNIGRHRSKRKSAVYLQSQ